LQWRRKRKESKASKSIQAADKDVIKGADKKTKENVAGGANVGIKGGRQQESQEGKEEGDDPKEGSTCCCFGLRGFS
jgi:hypothetical protein